MHSQFNAVEFYILYQGSANLFSKGPDRTFFRHGVPGSKLEDIYMGNCINSYTTFIYNSINKVRYPHGTSKAFDSRELNIIVRTYWHLLICGNHSLLLIICKVFHYFLENIGRESINMY